MTPADKSFLDYRLLKNQNYVTGLLFIFIVGLVLYATRALTPTMLETLLDYPVATTGLVTAPSGIGTMFAMLIAGRIIGKSRPAPDPVRRLHADRARTLANGPLLARSIRRAISCGRA